MWSWFPRLFLHHWNTFQTGQTQKASWSWFHDIQLLSPKRRTVTRKRNSGIISENNLILRSQFFQLFFHVKYWNIVSVYFAPVLPNMWKAFLLQYDFKNSSSTANHFTFHFENYSSHSIWKFPIVKIIFLNDWCVRILKSTIFLSQIHPFTFLYLLPFVYFLYSLLFLILSTWFFFLIWL